MTMAVITEALKPVFEQCGGKVVFAYLFRSVAKGEVAPLSDVDVAVYLHDNLNTAPVVLKYQVIKEGVVTKENRLRQVLFGTETLREYLDTAHLRDVQFQ